MSPAPTLPGIPPAWTAAALDAVTAYHKARRDPIWNLPSSGEVTAIITALRPLVAAEERERAERAEARLAELENAVTWETSCLSCSRVLDASAAERERAERAEAERDAARSAAASDRGRAKAAEADLAALRSVLLEGGQDDASVRRRAIAIIGAEGQPAPEEPAP